MAYCTAAQVQAEFKDLPVDSDSAISATDLGQWIEEFDAVIDSYVGVRYVTPVTGDASLAILRMIEIWLVKSRILPILSVKTPEDKTKQDPDGPGYYKKAMDMLTQIKKGQLPLLDATSTGSGSRMTSYNKDLTVTREFKKDRANW